MGRRAGASTGSSSCASVGGVRGSVGARGRGPDAQVGDLQDGEREKAEREEAEHGEATAPARLSPFPCGLIGHRDRSITVGGGKRKKGPRAAGPREVLE